MVPVCGGGGTETAVTTTDNDNNDDDNLDLEEIDRLIELQQQARSSVAAGPPSEKDVVRDSTGPASGDLFSTEVCRHAVPKGVHLVDGLDAEQRLAITFPPNRPLAILASAGSGKTTVLTHRIAYFVDYCDIAPSNILGVTFTLRAARELANRVGRSGVTVCTFHSLCLRILYANIASLPHLKPGVSVIPRKDALEAVTKAISDWRRRAGSGPSRSGDGGDGLGPPSLPQQHVLGGEFSEAAASRDKADSVLKWIELMKTRGISPAEFPPSQNRAAYEAYANLLRQRNCVDFVDMMSLVVGLFQSRPEICEKYRQRFQHILVDEWQDSNRIQFQLVQLLVHPQHPSITVVGDDDQSIYSFRGATGSQIFAMFRSAFAGDESPTQQRASCATIALKTNYRCTQTILKASRAVVERNPFREPKSLMSAPRSLPGEVLRLHVFSSVEDEIEFVCNDIIKSKRPFGSIAVLCRVRRQILGAFARAFRRKGIACSFAVGQLHPSSAAGSGPDAADSEGQHGYGLSASLSSSSLGLQRSELLAYLQMCANPRNNAAFRKVLNRPKRGLGPSVVEYLEKYSQMSVAAASAAAGPRATATAASGVCLWENLLGALKDGFPALETKFPRRPAAPAQKSLQEFVGYIRETLRARLLDGKGTKPSEILSTIMRDVDYDPDEDYEMQDMQTVGPPSVQLPSSTMSPLLGKDLVGQIRCLEQDPAFEEIADPLLRVQFVLDSLSLQADLQDDDVLVSSLHNGAADPTVPQALLQPSSLALSLSLSSSSSSQSPSSVTLTTVHQAKGLEWSTVYLIRANEGILPASASMADCLAEGDTQAVEEERRLMYVAMTRARERLVVSAVCADEHARLSRFLWEIPPEVLSIAKGYSAAGLKRNAFRTVAGTATHDGGSLVPGAGRRPGALAGTASSGGGVVTAASASPASLRAAETNLPQKRAFVGNPLLADMEEDGMHAVETSRSIDRHWQPPKQRLQHPPPPLRPGPRDHPFPAPRSFSAGSQSRF